MATIKIIRPPKDPYHVENGIKERVRPEHQQRVKHVVFNELEGKIAPSAMATSKDWRIDVTDNNNQLIARIIGGPGANIGTIFGPPGYPPDKAFPNIPSTTFTLRSVRAIQPRSTTAQTAKGTTKELSILQEVFQKADEDWNSATGTPISRSAQTQSIRREYEMPLIEEIFMEAEYEANDRGFIFSNSTPMEYMTSSNERPKLKNNEQPKRDPTAKDVGGTGKPKVDATAIFEKLLRSRLQQKGIIADEENINKWVSRYSQKAKKHSEHIHKTYNVAVAYGNEYLDAQWNNIIKNKV